MSFLGRLFRWSASSPPASTSHTPSQITSGHSLSSAAPAGSQNATRRELLRVVLRDTLQRHGIPTSWIAGETLIATSRQHASGIHWRLVIKHWDPRLLAHGVAFQHALIKRVMSFDPLASGWLMGISWQFQLADESVCPPLPHAGTWTAEPRGPAPAAPPVLPGGAGDVIAGPVVIGAARTTAAPDPSTARADLEKLFAVRDADRQRHEAGDPDTPAFAATRPGYVATEPAQL